MKFVRFAGKRFELFARGRSARGFRKPPLTQRQRLIGVGADYIVPNFLARQELMGALFSDARPIQV